MAEPGGRGESGPAAARTARMTADMCDAVARFHERFAGNVRLTAEVLRYEYFDNPVPGGGLYCSLDANDNLMATQGFIPHRLRRGPAELDSLMIERTLCRPDLRKSGVLVALGAAAMRELHPAPPWPMLWGKTSIASTGAIECLVDHRKPLAGPDAAAPERELVPVEKDLPAALDFLEQVYAAHPDALFLSFTEPMLRWMALTNPFVRFDVGVLRGAAGIEAFTVVRHAWEGMARVDELLTLPGADLHALLAALEQDLRRRQFRGMRFVLNGLREEDRPLWQALHDRGFASKPDPTMVSVRHGSRPAREILRDCAVSGLWAPPYWAPA